jgi:hypothetical protein
MSLVKSGSSTSEPASTTRARNGKLGSVGQLRTRFQAFVESLEIKKINAEGGV